MKQGNGLMEKNAQKSSSPALQKVIGALVFGAPEPLTIKQLHNTLVEVADTAAHAGTDGGGSDPEAAFAEISEDKVHTAVEALRRELEERPLGMRLVETAGGYRIFTDTACAPWLRHVLKAEKPAQLSRPALETLAVIAYRQPVSRSEIEAVRGVSVAHVVRNLLELQLVRITGRSELPGRPLLYGTSQKFLEHFGLKNLGELPGIAELSRRNQEAAARQATPETKVEQKKSPPVSGGAPDTPNNGNDKTCLTGRTDES